jgi:VanZ family protein
VNQGGPAAGRGRQPIFRAEFSLPAASPAESFRRGWAPISVLWLLFALFVVYAATIPFRYVGDLALVHAKLSALPLNPLVSPDTGRRVSIPDVVQNVLLFVPFGILGMLAPGGAGRLRRIAFVTVLGLALSVFVETLQLFTADRVTSLGDVVADAAGTLIGAALVAIQERAFRGFLTRFSDALVARKALSYPLIVFVAAVCVAEWHPFDVTLDVSSVWGHVKAFRAHPWDTGPLTDELLEGLRFAAAGGAIAVWLRSCQVRKAGAIAAAAGVVLACGLETSQFLIESRGADLRDAAVHGVGAIAGAALLARSWRIRPAVATTVVYALTVCGAAIQELSPFAVGSTRHPLEWMPFLSYYQYTSTLTISHVLELLLMFLPFGFVLSLSVARGRGWLLASAATAAAVIPLEIAQGFVPGRFPDVSDIAVCIAGALAGVWLGSIGWQKFNAAVAA